MNVIFGTSLKVHKNGVEETPCGMKIRTKRPPIQLVPSAVYPINCKECLETEERYTAELGEYINKLVSEVEAGKLQVDGAMWRLSGYLEEKLLK